MREFKKFQFYDRGKWIDTIGIVDNEFLCQNPDCNRRLTSFMRQHTKYGEKNYHYCFDCQKTLNPNNYKSFNGLGKR
jgi:hypothetical protein